MTKHNVAVKLLSTAAVLAALSATPALAWRPITVENLTSYGDPHHGVLLSITLTDVSASPPKQLHYKLDLGFEQTTTFVIPESGSCSRNIALYTAYLPFNPDGTPYYTILGDKNHKPGPFNDCAMSTIIVSGAGVMTYR